MGNETVCDICGKLYPILELSLRDVKKDELVLGEGKVIVCPHCL